MCLAGKYKQATESSYFKPFLYASEFSNERLRVERRAEFYKRRSKLLFNEALNRYLDWIIKSGDQ